MSQIKRERTKVVVEDFIQCDAASELDGRIFCCLNQAPFAERSSAFPSDTSEPDWVRVVLMTETNTKHDGKVFHFCPSHAKETDARLARVLEP